MRRTTTVNAPNASTAPNLVTDGASVPLLTIGVPTHGRPALLERALRSVIDRDQGVADRVELLVSDNSPDLNEAIVGSWLKAWQGPRQYLPNRPNIGAIPNFNQCIERATGKYLLLLHDDDFLLAGALESIVKALGQADESDHALLFGVAVVDIDGHVRRRQAFQEDQRLGPDVALTRLLSDSSFVRIPAIVFRRSTLLEIGEFDTSVGNPTDFDLLIRLFARHGVHCLPATIAGYTVHSDAATSSMFHESMIQTLTELFDRAVRTGVLPERTVRQCETDWFHQFILGGTYRPLRAGDTSAARTVFGLFRLPAMRRLGRSRRWLAVRWLFRILLLLPSAISNPMMRMVGRLSPERLWMPL